MTRPNRRRRTGTLTATLLLMLATTAAHAGNIAALFARPNLVPWCIVPYDARHRTPRQRVDMLVRLGFRKYAYDWRDQHLPGFDEELTLLQQHHIELTGVWFPADLGPQAQQLLTALKSHHIKTQLWVTMGIDAKTPDDQAVTTAMNALVPVAERAANDGHTLALYNHGGWFGVPEHQLLLLAKLKDQGLTNTGIVYNLHHAYTDVDRLAAVLQLLKPHLLCLNLNGVDAAHDPAQFQILPLAAGSEDLSILRTLRDSGYTGPVGILNHTDRDAEARLLDNLDGLNWLLPQLDGQPNILPHPQYRSFSNLKFQIRDSIDHWTVEDAKARAALPLYQSIPPAPVEDLTPALPSPVNPATWTRSHANQANTRFSPLAQVTRENVTQLKEAWTYHAKDGASNVQCNPIIDDGKIYFPTPGGAVVAVDASTGSELWRVELHPPKSMTRTAYRGLTIATLPDGSKRLLFHSHLSLYALDPASGKPVDSFGDHGHIATPPSSCAPCVYRNILLTAGFFGDALAYDLLTGRPLWTFHTLPTGSEPYADTWDKPDEQPNAWGGGIALDEARGILYLVTGSPKPNFLGARHLGDNLFGNCVLAIDAETGIRLWHFQEIRHDIWDLDITAPPVLMTLDFAGKKVDAIAACSKIGNTLLLDRVTGKPLFPFRLRRAPASILPGERTAPYQPDLELPEPFANPVFTKDDVTNISKESRHFIQDKIEKAKYGFFEPFDENRPNVVPCIHGGAEWTGCSYDPASETLYLSANHFPWLETVTRSEKPLVDETKLPPTPGRLVYQTNCMPCHAPSREGKGVAPSLLGLNKRLADAQVLALLKTGRASMPAAPQLTDQNKHDLLEYLFDRDRKYDQPTTRPDRPNYVFDGYHRLLDKDNYPGSKPPWGTLVAIHLPTGRIRFQVPLGEYPQLTARGVPKTGTENFGGPTATAAGLVFVSGTRDALIRAFDSKNGQELWSHPLPHTGSAPPTVYQVNGKQYVLIPATGGGKLETPPGDTYVAFALP